MVVSCFFFKHLVFPVFSGLLLQSDRTPQRPFGTHRRKLEYQHKLFLISMTSSPIGNRVNANLAGTTVRYTANMLNQYTAVNAGKLTYDDDANMLTNGTWTYAWNCSSLRQEHGLISGGCSNQRYRRLDLKLLTALPAADEIT